MRVLLCSVLTVVQKFIICGTILLCRRLKCRVVIKMNGLNSSFSWHLQWHPFLDRVICNLNQWDVSDMSDFFFFLFWVKLILNFILYFRVWVCTCVEEIGMGIDALRVQDEIDTFLLYQNYMKKFHENSLRRHN